MDVDSRNSRDPAIQRRSVTAYEYQALIKQYPSYAANYTELMLRLERNHFGQINTQKPKITSMCMSMLQSVETIAQRACIR